MFPIPEYLHKNVVSLLCHMLQTDPMRRATVAEIREHEWFKKGLQPYLFPERDIGTAMIDEDAVMMTCEVGKKSCSMKDQKQQ